MHIVGLTGHTGAGKNTVAGRMWAAHGFEILSFDAPVWAALDAAGVIELECVFDPRYRNTPVACGKTPLQLMEEMRTWGLAQDPAFWLRSTRAEVEQASRAGVQRVVFADVRDDIQAAWIHVMGGDIWNVTRKPFVGDAGGISTKFINRGIVNDGSMDALYWRVEQLVDELLHPNGMVTA